MQPNPSASPSLPQALSQIPGLLVSSSEPLGPHTSMGVGGPARWFLEVDRRDALAPALAALRESAIPFMMLGGGSNTLFADEGFDGAILHLGKEFRAIEPGSADDEVRAAAGANLSAIMNFAKRRGLAGLEFCAGIPGVLGGALAGNAGAGGHDICTVAESVDILDADLAPRTLRRGEFEFRYRHCELKKFVILGATLKLRPEPAEAIQERINAHLSKRWEQPVGSKTSGCMFKNPPGDAAGRMIDRAGLKGLRVGGVFVSPEHANFMINEGAATTADILRLMEEVRSRILSATGITLESEVRVIPPRPERS